jgi:hypothetical protein
LTPRSSRRSARPSPAFDQMITVQTQCARPRRRTLPRERVRSLALFGHAEAACRRPFSNEQQTLAGTCGKIPWRDVGVEVASRHGRTNAIQNSGAAIRWRCRGSRADWSWPRPLMAGCRPADGVQLPHSRSGALIRWSGRQIECVRLDWHPPRLPTVIDPASSGNTMARWVSPSSGHYPCRMGDVLRRSVRLPRQQARPRLRLGKPVIGFAQGV